MGYRLEPWDSERRLLELTDPVFAAAEKRRRREAGYRDQLQPQQLVISDALDVEHDTYLFEIVRRASKTTSIFMKLIGRCASRDDYQVTFSAQSGVVGSRRLREWGARLDDVNPPDDQDLPPWMRNRARKTARQVHQVALFGEEITPVDEPKRRGFKIMRGEVGKGIYFENGSTFLVLKPEADAYRSEGADASWLDEFQEVDPETGVELVAAITPLQDTKIGSALILSGTAGPARVGPFWLNVDGLRGGKGDIGGLDYAVPEDTPWEVIEDEAQAMALLASVHPGIGTLTTIEKMIKNYRKPEFGRPQWAMEYLSLWPETFGTIAIDPGQWSTAGLSGRRPRPERVAFGMAIKPGGSVAAVCAAWRDARGIAYIEVVQHRPGTRWMVFKKNSGVPDTSSGWLQYLTRKYRGATVAYDRMGEGEATATEAARLRPPPRLAIQSFRDTSAGCVQLLRDLERGTLRHFNQVGLNSAVALAAKREIRGEANGVFLWTPAEPGADITTLDAATRALRNWDQHFARGGGALRAMDSAK